MKFMEMIDYVLLYNQNLLRIKKGEAYFARDDISEEKKEKNESIFTSLCKENDEIAYKLQMVLDLSLDELEWGISLPNVLIRDMVEVELLKLKTKLCISE